jgi:hypothetical protein
LAAPLTPPDRLRRRRSLLVAGAVALLAVGLAAGFYLGQRAAWTGMGVDPALYQSMRADLPVKEAALAEREKELEVLRTRREVDRRALEMVRVEIATQKEQIADLEEGLRFYKSLMIPGEINQGLSLRPLELLAREQPGHYAFRIVAQQQALKHQLLKGSLVAEVNGTREGEPVSYPLASLSSDLDEEAMALRFRYFQAIEGELRLPAGFEPAGVTVVATINSPRKFQVREEFSWQLKERFTHVGK